MGNIISNQVTDPTAKFLEWSEQASKAARQHRIDTEGDTPEKKKQLEEMYATADALAGQSHTDRDGDGGTSEPNGHVMTRNQK